MNAHSIHPRLPESGSALIFVLVAVVLFAALTYAISRGGEGARNLTQEKIRLTASEIIDTGNRASETVSRLKLRGVSEAEISFEYSGDYVNAGCTTDACKIFAYDGGGIDWETPPSGVNNGEDWGYTGDIAITDIGTTEADMVMFLPDLTSDVCHRINVLLGIETETATSPTVATAISAAQFTGAYNGSPTTITQASIDGKKSGCLQVGSMSGTAVDGSPLTTPYVFYQVLIAR